MKLMNLVRNALSLGNQPLPNPMIVLLVIPWIFLATLTVTVCVSARRGDLNQKQVGADPVERTHPLGLPRDSGGRELPQSDDARRAAA
jgi:hypothetical protein